MKISDLIRKALKHDKDIINLNEQLDTNTNKLVGETNITQYKELVVDDDWSTALQQAINELDRNNKIIIPNINGNIITIKNPVYLKSNLTLEGLQGLNSYNNNIIINFTENGCLKSPDDSHIVDVNMKNIVFKYNGNLTNIDNIIACQRLKIENCSFIGFNIGLKLTTYLNEEIQSNNNIVENKIIDCSFYNNNYGLVVEGNGYGHVTDGFLTRCIFSRNLKQDASLNGNCGGWDINGCHFYSPEVTDYSLQISNMLNTVTNCYFEPSLLQLKLNLNSSLGINIISNNKFMQDKNNSISIDVVATQEQRSLIITNNIFRWVNPSTALNCIGINIADNGSNVYGNYNNSFFGYTLKYNCFNKYHSRIIDYNDNYCGINSSILSLMSETSKINIRCSYGDLSTIDNIGSILIDYKNAKLYISNGIKWCALTMES